MQKLSHYIKLLPEGKSVHSEITEAQSDKSESPLAQHHLSSQHHLYTPAHGSLSK